MRDNPVFIFNEGADGVWREPFHSLIAGTAIAISVFVLGFFVYGGLNLSLAGRHLLNRFQVEAFIDHSVPDDEHAELEGSLQVIDSRWQLSYISRDSAAARFALQFDPGVFNVLNQNPLPASFVISLPTSQITPDSIALIAEALSGLPFIEDVVYDRELLSLVHSGMQKLIRWGLIIGFIVVWLALGLTFNAIRLKIDHQKEAIRRMSHLGATPLSLRAIFWVQGAILGLAGGLISAGAIGLLALLAGWRLGGALPVQIPALYLLPLTGFLMGFAGSALAVGRYLSIR